MWTKMVMMMLMGEILSAKVLLCKKEQQERLKQLLRSQLVSFFSFLYLIVIIIINITYVHDPLSVSLSL
jgi:nitrogen fixation/metabolism regulation signal transduction histidine kinase